MTSPLEPVIAQVITDVLAQKARTGAKGELLLIITAGWLAAAGLLLLVWALYGFMAIHFTPPQAALLAGVAVLMVAAILTGIAAIRMKSRADQPADRIPQMADALEKSLMEISHELEGPVRENPMAALMIAGIAGFMSGKKLH